MLQDYRRLKKVLPGKKNCIRNMVANVRENINFDIKHGVTREVTAFLDISLMAHSLEERESEVYDEFFATKEDDEYEKTANNNEEIMFRTSTDGGATFGDKINWSNTTNVDSWKAEIDSC
jgi:hypothetical protein